MKELTAFQRDLMYAVSSLHEPYGLEVKRHLESYYGHEVNHAQLYPNMDKLVDRGLIRKGSKDRRTNSYALTPDGQRALRERRQWANAHAPVESENPSAETAEAAEN